MKKATENLEVTQAGRNDRGWGADPGWRPVRRVRAYEQVLAQIEERIRAGVLKPGDRLPGERQLSAMLGVSRASVREALRVLEALEIVVARTGRGDDAGSTIRSEPGEALSSLLRFQVALNRFSIDDLVETRVMVERWAAERAASRARSVDLERMAEAIRAMEAPDLTPAQFNAADTGFHVAVASAGRNEMVIYWMQAIREAVQLEMAAAFERLTDWRATAARLTEEHRAIHHAIAEGRGEAAAGLVADHIMAFYRQVGMMEGDR